MIKIVKILLKQYDTQSCIFLRSEGKPDHLEETPFIEQVHIEHTEMNTKRSF